MVGRIVYNMYLRTLRGIIDLYKITKIIKTEKHDLNVIWFFRNNNTWFLAVRAKK